MQTEKETCGSRGKYSVLYSCLCGWEPDGTLGHPPVQITEEPNIWLIVRRNSFQTQGFADCFTLQIVTVCHYIAKLSA